MYVNYPEFARQLLAGTHVYQLHRRTTVSGIVVDMQGQPVPGAKVEIDSDSLLHETTSRPDGDFTLPDCKTGPARINVEAQGFVLATVNTNITNHQPPLRLELRRGDVLRLRVVDTNGMPVANATVGLNSSPYTIGPRSNNVFGTPGDLSRKKTDAQGRLTWDAAPPALLFNIRADGYQWNINAQLVADGQERQVTLHAAHAISGTVSDAATHQPIPAFHIVTGQVGVAPLANDAHMRWGDAKTFHDGAFHFVDDDGGTGAQFKVEADGYAPYVTRVIGQDESSVSLDIELYPAVAKTVTVLLPDGHPATNASIGLDMPGTSLKWIPGGFSPPMQGSYSNVLFTDNAGHFTLAPDDSVTRVIAACADGYAESTPAVLATNSTMALQPWGRIEGTLMAAGKPVGKRTLTVGQAIKPHKTMIYFFDVMTDGDGRFLFPMVPPGQFRLYQSRLKDSVQLLRPLQVPDVTVRLGETTSVLLALYTVTARLDLPSGVEMKTNWTASMVASRRSTRGSPRVSAQFAKSGNGTWMAEELPAGDYTLTASVVESRDDATRKKLMRTELPFTLPGDSSTGTLDLGNLTLEPVQ